MEPLVLPLDAAEAREPALVGSKGASLARLVGAGLPVPEGFCVTTRAFAAFVDDGPTRRRVRALSGLRVEEPQAVAEAARALRAHLETRPLPDRVSRAIAEALAAYGAERAWAVRSSATAEDLPDASFAGQLDSFLNVRGLDALLLHVRRSMARLYRERAHTYRARQGVPHDDVALAVVVQRMVRADASGVLFTADPLTGNRFVTAIDAGFGLGEAVVAGRVAPDQVRVDVRGGRLLEYRTGAKRCATEPRVEGGTQLKALPPEVCGAHVLSDEDVRTLVGLGQRAQAVNGAPQDVEWCREGGRFLLLQARPITSLFPLLSPLPHDGALHVYQSFNHRQGMTEAVPPLVADTWCRCIPFGKRRGSTERSCWSATAGGRVYFDLTPLLTRPGSRRRILAQMPKADARMALAVEEVVRRPGFDAGPKVSLGQMFPWMPLAWAGFFAAL
ncbi:MAG: phosphoenolpyruvate synthase, partial [Myxococcaceae bacterium]|nr:phosphoenolpyruvate synthase [Myxococcaceae bacterium]